MFPRRKRLGVYCKQESKKLGDRCANFRKDSGESWAWSCILLTPALRRWIQENQEFKIILSYLFSVKLAWAT